MFTGDPILDSPSYRKAYEDVDLLHRDELRSVRLELELLKADLIQHENGIVSTIVVFGSARIAEPEEAARRLEAAEAEARARPGDAGARRYAEQARRAAANSRF